MTLANDLLGDPARRREARRRSAHEFRSRRTTAAMVVAAVMTAVGGIGSAEIVARQHRQNVIPPQYLDRVNAELHRLQWQDRTVVLVGYGLAAVGLVLLLHALLPGRTRLEMIRGSDPYLSAGLSHAGFRRALTDAASGVPGVCGVSVRVRRRVVVRAHAHREAAGLVRAAVTARLAEIDPARSRRVVVRLSRRRG